MPDQQSTNTATSAAEAYFAELRAVDKYIASDHFAHVTEFKPPFSEQVKVDVRNRIRIPEDIAIFDKTDDLQRQSARHYVWLRAITALLFVVFVSAGIVIRREFMAPLTELLSRPLLAQLVTFGAVLLCGFIFWLFRQGARWYVLDYRIGATVRDLAVIVLARFNKLVSDTKSACGHIDERADFGADLGWAQRAQGWARIALWYAIRTRALDTYTTTVFWKMRVFDTDIERLSRLLKGILLLVALSVLFDLQGDGMHASPTDWILFGVSLIIWVVAWYFLFIHWGKRISHGWYTDVIVLLLAYGAWTTAWLQWCGKVDIATVSIGALFVGFFWFGWIVSGERDDNDWADIFASKLGHDEVARMNTAFYFESISKRIENLIEQIIDDKRSAGQRGGPPKSGNT